MYIHYTLKPHSRKYPHVFIIIRFDHKKPSFDLSQYKYITLRIAEAHSQKITLFIKTFEQGISKFSHQSAATLRHDEKVFSLSPSLDEYKINLREFVTPQWWYNNFHTSEKQIGQELFNKAVSFDLHFIHPEENTVKDESKTLTIEEISFHKPVSLVSFILAGVFILYYCLGIPWFKINRKKRNKKMLLPYVKHLDYINYRDKELSRIKEYIDKHFDDPDISTKKLQRKMGIPSVKIFNLIKDEYKCSFKQLINTIRVQKAKSLIKDSDLRIIEISYKIGFNDSTYFNKIFKQIAGITPTELRDKNTSVIRTGKKIKVTRV
ncbi:MAG: helix-turn-helix transcriptional regulator [Spirochaetales bacterium]|nr:helix-turn-helix transcriptional regulator [Spirochaetales bacterium]